MAQNNPETTTSTNQPVNNHDDLLGVVDGLLEEMGLDRGDTGGMVTFAWLDPLRPTVLNSRFPVYEGGAVTMD